MDGIGSKMGGKCFGVLITLSGFYAGKPPALAWGCLSPSMDYVCEPYVFGGIREGAMGLAQGTWPSHPLRIYQLAMSTLARSGSLYITWLNSRLQKTKGVDWRDGCACGESTV